MGDILYFLANHNFFDRPTIIRKWQCFIFGHEYFGRSKRKDGTYWCSWCGSAIGKYPKMRERKEEPIEIANKDEEYNESYVRG